MKKPQVIGFDADDTLWVNEPFFRQAEEKFSLLMKDYGNAELITQQLFDTEVGNLHAYGYGIKSFILSMMECAMDITNHRADHKIVDGILNIGKEMLRKPVELLDGVEETLSYLKAAGYRLIVATKGDLVDQERKLRKSQLQHYFHHIEIMSDKQPANYERLLKSLDIPAGEFLMVGNSLKSDIIPLIEIGAQAIHIPFHTTWQHETVDNAEQISDRFISLTTLTDIKDYL
jgi:putative hydrolase of the HAD superfamily